MVGKIRGRWLIVLLFTVPVGSAAPVNAGALVFGHSFHTASAVGKWARDYGACVAQRYPVHVDLLGSRSLGSGRSLAYQLSRGGVDMAIVSASTLQEVWPQLRALTVPGLVEDPRRLVGRTNKRDVLRQIEQTAQEYQRPNIVNIGWRYAVLVGVDNKLERSVQGARIRPYNEASREALDRLGAHPVAVRTSALTEALRSGYLDGALVGVDTAQRLVDRDAVNRVYVDWDFLPFADALLLIVSDRAARLYGGRLPDELRYLCVGATEGFNKAELGRVRSLEDIARRKKQLRVFEGRSRDTWRSAFEKVHLSSEELAIRKAIRGSSW